MAETEQGMPERPVVVMDVADDVATALRDLRPGERIAYRQGDREDSLAVQQPVPFGHKIALRAIPAGAPVHKYGAVIGRAAAAIAPGEHVHVHNLEGIRGRGDLAARSAGQGGAGSRAASR